MHELTAKEKEYIGTATHAHMSLHPGHRCDFCFVDMTDPAEMDPLSLLGRKYGTDKGGWHLIAGETCHNYLPTYHELFKDRREEIKHVLEIGVNYGCSLRMWAEYFPNAIITGLDSNAGALFNEGRIRCFPADQYNEDSLNGALALAGDPKFDFIVDDGSHEPHHQVFSARVLMSRLAPGGLYVIEDIYPDCKPELIGDQLSQYPWEALDTGTGLGKAHCGCGCGTGEKLLVFRNV